MNNNVLIDKKYFLRHLNNYNNLLDVNVMFLFLNH